MKITFEKIVSDHLEFTSRTFPKGTSIGALLHAEREIKEVIEELEMSEVNKQRLCVEYADIFGCITDSANRAGLEFIDIILAWNKKLTINKSREWKDNGDGSYSHIKK